MNNLSLIDSEKLYEYIYQSISIYISPFSNFITITVGVIVIKLVHHVCTIYYKWVKPATYPDFPFLCLPEKSHFTKLI